jgi:nitrous oxide reductase accessory protein NosL
MRKLLAIITVAILLASCTTTRHHACGITELNKQYSKNCR